MNKINSGRLYILGLLLSCTIACNDHTTNDTPNQLSSVKDSVQIMAESIAKNISREGPVVWLRYFENTPDFFMASGGKLVFPNYDSATNFIKNILVKSIHNIELKWSDMRIDPLTKKLACLSANFHEDIFDYSGKQLPVDGYFTAVAEQTSHGWQLRNAHWSIADTK